MTQYLLLKSDGEPDDPSVGLTSDSQGEGGVLGGDNYTASETVGVTRASGFLSTFQTTETSSSSPIGNTQASSLIDQQGGVFSQTTAGKNKLFIPNSEELSIPQSSELESALSSPPVTIVVDMTILGPEPDWNTILSWTAQNDQGNQQARMEITGSTDAPYTRWVSDPASDGFSVGDGGMWARNVEAWEYGLEHHQASVYNGSQILNYTNGSVESSTSISTDLGDLVSGLTFRGGENGFLINNLAIYDEELTESEIQSAEDGELQHPSSAVIYTFDNVSGDTVYDESGNGNHATRSSGTELAPDVQVGDSSSLQPTGTSTTLSNALRDAFSASTFGNSSSDTTAGGLTELFTHADQPADLDTSTVVNALTENFDTVQRTAIGDALTGVTGDTTVATANGLQSLGNALAEPLVAAETALFTEQDAAGSFADAYADALRASGSTLPTGAAGNTAVTSLGTAEVATGTPQFGQTTVEMFAFVSPESTTASPTVGTFDTSTSAVALTENAVMVPITPTMDVVVAVKKGEIGLEGAFADSLAADVGASTSIKVAKTVADAEQQGGALDTSAVPDAFAATAEAIQQSGDGFADSTVEALTVAAALQSFGSSSTTTGTLGELVSSDSTTVGADGFSSATPDAAVRDVVASELDASADTSATSESLAEAAQTLTEQGLADTQVEAAALVAQVAAKRQQGQVDTFAGVEGLTEEFESIERAGRPSTFTLSEAAREVFSAEVIDTDALAEALPLISATLVSTVNVNGAASTDATSDGDVTGTDMSPVDALLRILFAAIEGSNAAIPITEQNVRVENAQNYAKVVN